MASLQQKEDRIAALAAENALGVQRAAQADTTSVVGDSAAVLLCLCNL